MLLRNRSHYLTVLLERRQGSQVFRRDLTHSYKWLPTTSYQGLNLGKHIEASLGRTEGSSRALHFSPQ